MKKKALLATLFLPTWLGAQNAARPFEITDNSFFIEEAFNQEPGIVQNIFTWQWVRDVSGGKQDSLSFSFTQEWPIPAQTHQFSFVIPAEYLSSGGVAAGGGLSGWGDVLLNYRYQALSEEDAGVAFAPRLSLILPTGDPGKGFGAGTAGYQFNLPFSKQLQNFYVHLNTGMTFFPGAEAQRPEATLQEDLWGYHLGASFIWRTHESVNLLLEALLDRMDEFEGEGKQRVARALLAPGIRWGRWLGRMQLVAGTAFPVGLTDQSDDFGVFFYLSLEFPFR